MSLRLVSSNNASNNDRAVAIRDRILPLLRQHGTVQTQRDAVRLTELRMDPWTFCHWTPFNELTGDEASSPGYRHAIERQRTRQTLPYGLDVWHVEKVLSILWAPGGAIVVASFIRGPWEELALKL